MSLHSGTCKYFYDQRHRGAKTKTYAHKPQARDKYHDNSLADQGEVLTVVISSVGLQSEQGRSTLDAYERTEE